MNEKYFSFKYYTLDILSIIEYSKSELEKKCSV